MNIAELFISQVKKDPYKKAVIAPAGYDHLGRAQKTHLTFLELHLYSSSLAETFRKKNIQSGDRVLVMIRPTLEFSAVVWALFKLGAVCVFMDPGMGVKALMRAMGQNRPKAYIGEKELLPLSLFYRAAFNSLQVKISRTPSWWSKTNLEELGKDFFSTLNQRPQQEKEGSEIVPRSMDDLAAILFTSGGTGAPKGVEYTHGIFTHQIKILQEVFQLTSEDRDLPGFPLFSLFTQIMGMSSFIPDMNPSQPSSCDPAKIALNLLQEKITFAAGSPIIWERVGAYARKNALQFPHLKYVVMFGAPAPVTLIECWKGLIPVGDTYTPYGATECLPLTLISGQEILQLASMPTIRSGEGFEFLRGTCVGRVVPGMSIGIFKNNKDDKKDKNDKEKWSECAPLEMGEIFATGPVRTIRYADLPEETQKSKIMIEDKLWHRMGDVGYFDEEKRLWFGGRSVHQLEVLNPSKIYHSVPIENYFYRMTAAEYPALPVNFALVGVSIQGKRQVALAIEEKNLPLKKRMTLLKKTPREYEEFLVSLQKWAKECAETQGIEHFYFCRHFPVDGRHNIKIDRQKIGRDLSVILN